MKLAVYVAAYCDWGIDLDDIALLDQQLAGFVAEVADGGFRDGLAGAEIGDGTVGRGQRWIFRRRSRCLNRSRSLMIKGIRQRRYEFSPA